MKDAAREDHVWGEINVLRYAIISDTLALPLTTYLRQAMINYGARSPIGSEYIPFTIGSLIHSHTARQEKLLQGLMKEIVRLTHQKQPLEVGLPLYPFSHATLFAPTIPSNAQMAPLPIPSTSHSMEYDSPSFVQNSLYCLAGGNAPLLPTFDPNEQSHPQESGLMRWNYRS